jgi:hypothetical protein
MIVAGWVVFLFDPNAAADVAIRTVLARVMAPTAVHVHVIDDSAHGIGYWTGGTAAAVHAAASDDYPKVLTTDGEPGSASATLAIDLAEGVVTVSCAHHPLTIGILPAHRGIWAASSRELLQTCVGTAMLCAPVPHGHSVHLRLHGTPGVKLERTSALFTPPPAALSSMAAAVAAVVRDRTQTSIAAELGLPIGSWGPFVMAGGDEAAVTAFACVARIMGGYTVPHPHVARVSDLMQSDVTMAPRLLVGGALLPSDVTTLQRVALQCDARVVLISDGTLDMFPSYATLLTRCTVTRPLSAVVVTGVAALLAFGSVSAWASIRMMELRNLLNLPDIITAVYTQLLASPVMDVTRARTVVLAGPPCLQPLLSFVTARLHNVVHCVTDDVAARMHARPGSTALLLLGSSLDDAAMRAMMLPGVVTVTTTTAAMSSDSVVVLPPDARLVPLCFVAAAVLQLVFPVAEI